MNIGTELLEALPSAIYLTDAEGRITYYNQAAAELWGCRPQIGNSEWCGSWRLYWPDGRPMPHDQCPMAVALREGRAVRGEEAIAERPDGTRVPFRPYPTPLKDSSGRIIGAINLLVDLSQEQRGDIQSERLAAIVSSSDDAIISKSLDGQILSWNAGAARIFGYEASEVIGKPITIIIPPELHQEEASILAKLQRGERIDHYDTVRVTKDGRRVDISLTVSPLRDRHGRVVGASKVGRDVTERKQAEKLQHLLLEELNHRVKNTLAITQAIASQSLRHSKTPAEFVSSFTGRIHALAKAHTLLTQAKLQGANVIDLVREQVLLGVADNRITCSGPLLTLNAQTSVQLALVLHELATNARKFGALSVPDGRLSVSWRVQTNGVKELSLTWRESGGPRVRAPAARGFGTTLIEQTLRSHGGEASVSYGADGVACAIRIPVSHEEGIGLHSVLTGAASSSALEQQSDRPSLEGKAVLIVEDEPLVSMDIVSCLKGVGCKIVGPAGNIDHARQLIDDARFDVVLLDVNLGGHPVDELAARLTQKGVPFAFVTGYGREALPAGYRDEKIVTKPFRSEDVLQTVQQLIGGQSKASAGVLPFKAKR